MRTIFSLLVLVSVFVLPYWAYLPAILAGIIIFPFYAEAILLALLVDALYGSSYVFGIIAAVLVMFAGPVRSYLRFNV